MWSKNSIPTLIALAVLVAPPAARAQTAAPPPELQEWLEEVQQLQARLEPIHQAALQDPAIQEEQEKVSAAVIAAMTDADPTISGKLERLQALAAEAQAAQANGDQERLVELSAEAQVLQPEIEEAQSQALSRPEIETQIETFRENLHQRMAQIDPEAQGLIERLQELERRIRTAIGS